MISLQISALEQHLDFVLHFQRQVSLYFLVLGFRLLHFDSKSEAFSCLCRWRIDYCTLTVKNVFQCTKKSSCIRSQTLVAAQHLTKTWNHCWLGGNVGQFATANRFYLKSFTIVHLAHSFQRDLLSIRSWRIRQFASPKISSILPLHGYFWCECLEVLFLVEPIIRKAWPALFIPTI